MLPTSLEKYLLCIYRMLDANKELKSTELARQMNQSLQKAVQALQRLHYQKYIVYSAYQPLKLTTKGEQMAEYLMARTALIDEFLEILQLTEHKEAEKEMMEQYLSYESLKKIEKFILLNREYPEIAKRYEMLLKKEVRVHLLPELPEYQKS